MRQFIASLLGGFSVVAFAANLMLNDTSFEADYGPWHRLGEIVACQDAPDGGHALKVNTSLMSYDRYYLSHSTPYTYSVYLKALEPDTRVLVQAYRTNWDGRFYQVETTVPMQWTRYAVAIPPQKEGDHNTFWMRVQPFNGKSVLLDAAQLEEGTQPTPYKSAEKLVFFTKVNSTAKGNTFMAGEDASLTAKFYNTQDKAVTFTSTHRVTDYYGKTVLDDTRTLNAEAHAAAEAVIPLPTASRKGFYQVDYSMKIDDATFSKTATFAVLPHPRKVLPGHRKLFGICGGTGELAEDMERMGIQATAIAFRWSYCDKNGILSKNYLDYADKAIEKLNRHGVDVHIYFRRTPAWAAVKPHPHDIYPPKAEYIKDYEDFAFKAVSHFKGRVKTFQLWGGEADLLCDTVATDLGMDRKTLVNTCIELHKAGYRGIKRADKDAIVQTTAVSGVDCTHAAFPFQREIIRGAKGFFDEVVIHPYCYPGTFGENKYVESPEEAKLLDKYDAIARLAGTTVTNGEIGYLNAKDEPYNSPANRRLADYMARTMILTCATANVRSLLWCCFAESENYAQWYWPNPRPSVSAWATVSSLLTNATEPAELAMGSKVKGYVFTAEKGSVAAIWIPGNEDITFDVANVKNVRFLDLMGNAVGAGEVVLSGTPVFAVSEMGRTELERALGNGRLRLAPVEVSLRLESMDGIAAYVSNLTPKPLPVTLNMDMPAQDGTRRLTATLSTLPANGKAKAILKPDAPLELADVNGRPVSVTATTPEGDVTVKTVFELLPCVHARSAMKIDGDLSDWTGIPCIELSTSEKLFPPDAASHGNWKGPNDLSVKAHIAWDETAFYFAAIVKDDIHVNAGNNRTLCGGDCIQLAFDPLNDAFVPGYASDDAEYNFAFSTALGGTLTSQTWPRPPNLNLGYPAIVRREEGITVYEAAIPREGLAALTLKKGAVFGFNFVAVDNDMNRNDYWMGITYGICAGKDPSVFRKFVLTDNN